jgi:hypothetical protein
MKLHVLKSWPDYFSEILEGRRYHELRRNDREYAVGDHLVLREYFKESGEYSGRWLVAEITSMTWSEAPCAVSRTALDPEFCILSVRLC